MDPLIPLSFLAGVLTKLSDETKNEVLASVFGFLYGLIHGLIGTIPILFPVVAGTTLGVLLAGKVDRLAHALGVSVTLVLLAFADKSFLPLFPILLSSYLDEKLGRARPLLPFTVLFLTPFLGVNALLFFVLWEAGYRFTSYTVSRGLIRLP